MSVSALYFRNTSNEDFTEDWDSVPYTVKAGQEVMLQSHIAIHLAMYLAMRELGKENKSTPINPARDEDGKFTNKLFSDKVASYLSTDGLVEETEEKLEIAMLMEEKKKKTSRQTKKTEEEFPDLKTKK